MREPPFCARAAVCQGAVWPRAELVNLRFAIFHEALQTHPVMADMEMIVRLQDQEHCASITCMIRHYAEPEGRCDLRSPA
jgi:hypothetical protein